MSMSEKASVIYEPMTSITDFLIFILGCYYGWYTLSLLNSVFHLIWGISFFVLGFGALLGGVKHGFGPKFSKTQKKIIWFLTLIFVGISSQCLFLSLFALINNNSINLVVIIILFSHFLLYVFKVLKNDKFLNAIKFYLPVLLISLIISLYTFLVAGYTGAMFISIGIVVTLVASLVQISNIILHKHFNNNDFFHVLQIIGMYFLYIGGLEIPEI